MGRPFSVTEPHAKDGTKVKVWKYTIDVGSETRGQYQPDFSIKSMGLSMTVGTNELAAKGVCHINDFVGLTTKDFKDIGAVIKAKKWDHSNWNTKKYTDLFGDKVNSGKTMASLSEGRGVAFDQASEIVAVSTFSVRDGQTGAVTYTLAYVVTDDGQGRLQATRAMKRTVAGATEDVDLGESGDAVGAVFANVYPDPSDPTTPQRPFARERDRAGTLPRTGDDGTWSAWASVVATLGLALRRQAAR